MSGWAVGLWLGRMGCLRIQFLGFGAAFTMAKRIFQQAVGQHCHGDFISLGLEIMAGNEESFDLRV